MRIAIVGAGIMGSSAALALAERGHEITLFERYGLNHVYGSSHGRSRIIRKAYPDAYYTAIMDEGYGLWRELQSHCATRIVFESGLLYFGKFESENLRDVLEGLEKLDVVHELLDHEQVHRVFPSLRLDPGEIGIFTPEAGWVNAERAVRTSVEAVQALGGTFIENERADIDRIAAEFNRYILCPGAWIKDFVDVPVRVTLQTFGYALPKTGGAVQGPVWIDDGNPICYGFPSEPGTAAIKIGVHEQGPRVDPATAEREPLAGHMVQIREEARRRFGLDDAEFTFQACLYTNTHDEDFLFGRHGDDGFFVSACSGHGFKFGPWIGRKLADFVEDKDAPENHPRFCWPKPRLEA